MCQIIYKKEKYRIAVFSIILNSASTADFIA